MADMKDRVGLVAFVVIGLLALSTFLQVIAIATDNWVDTVADHTNSVVGSSGLWKICTHPFSDRDSECRFFRWEDVQVSHWFRTVQALEVLGMVAGATALLMIILFSFVSTCAENKMLKIFTLIGCVIAFGMILSAGIVIACLKDVQKAYSVPGYTYMSWSFGLSITSSILYLITGVGVCFA